MNEIPTRTLAPSEWDATRLSQETHDWLQLHFRESGCVLLHNAFSRDIMQQMHDFFLRKYRRFLDPERIHQDAQSVGHRRWMVTIKLQKECHWPMLYAHPLLMPWMRQLLGEECILNNFGAVVSLPGARAQHEHRDLPLLFGENACSLDAPVFAMTVLAPLVPSDAQHGTTMVRIGSHRVFDQDIEAIAPSYPEIPVGSCLLMDYRLHHGGMENHSESARPLLYQVYSRPWFRDYRNFQKQPPLLITRATYRAVPIAYRALFATSVRTWW